MKRSPDIPVVDQLLSPLSDCLTPESARRLLALKPNPKVMARIDEMATLHTEGRLTPDESAEYGRYVTYSTFIAILKSKARQLLATADGE